MVPLLVYPPIIPHPHLVITTTGITWSALWLLLQVVPPYPSKRENSKREPPYHLHKRVGCGLATRWLLMTYMWSYTQALLASLGSLASSFFICNIFCVYSKMIINDNMTIAMRTRVYFLTSIQLIRGTCLLFAIQPIICAVPICWF